MKGIYLFLIFIFVFSFFSFAQVDNYPFVELVIGDVQYSVSAEGAGAMVYRNLESGKSIPIYSVIRSGPDGYAEIKLSQNKTIKIFSSTTLSLSKFQVDNTVDLRTGKVRAIFNKILKNDELRIKTDTGIAAVRGTDFGVIYSSGQGNISLMEVLVREGTVNLSTLDGKSVDIPAGYSSSINSYFGRVELEEPRPLSLNDFLKYFSEPQQIQQPADIQEPKEKEQKDLPKQPSVEPIQPKPGGIQGVEQGPKFDFGWEISSQNINGVVWNKILLSPIFRVGKFGIGLYLVSYWDGKNNIYDTTKWYNSYEYNFGFVGNEFIVTDFLDDLFKKILFISYGSKGENVFIRIGNIPDMTLGHGFIMDRYSNMLGFPAIRKVGLQFDLDFGYWGFESAVADLSRSRLFGGRIFVRPLYGTFLLGNIALGVSGVVDLEPYVTTNQQTFEGNPSVFFTGIDVDFPVLDLGVFSLVIFADVAKAGIYVNKLDGNPYFEQLLTDNGFNEGFNLLNGEGFSAGVNGYIVGIVPYRIEYRRITGRFLPSYFDALYDTQKSEKIFTLIVSNLPPFNGVLGYSGINISNVAEATIHYEQLWPEENLSFSVNRLIGRFKVSKEIVKMVTGLPSYATIIYQRNNIPSFNVFFEDVLKDSVMTFEIAYSIDPSMDVSISYRRFYASSTEYQDSISIQLRSSIFGEIGF